MSKTRNLLPTLIALALVVTIAIAVASQFLFNNTGEIVVIVEVEAYTDNSLTTPVALIEWGQIEPGQYLTEYIYINSTSNIPVVLNLTTTNWSTGAEEVIDLTWDLEGTTITAGEILEATLTLTAALDPQGVTAFSFDAAINASEE